VWLDFCNRFADPQYFLDLCLKLMHNATHLLLALPVRSLVSDTPARFVADAMTEAQENA
jgi:hypothetical protein